MLRKCQKKGKGKGKGKAPPKSKEIVDLDSGANSYDSEMYPKAAAAHNRAVEESAIGPTDGIPCYLRCFVDPTGFGVDNDFDSHVYDNFRGHDGYRRYVSNSPLCALSNDEQQQLLNALSSLESRLDLIQIHSTCCKQCERNKDKNNIDFLADSGTSLSFTNIGVAQSSVCDMTGHMWCHCVTQ